MTWMGNSRIEERLESKKERERREKRERCCKSEREEVKEGNGGVRGKNKKAKSQG